MAATNMAVMTTDKIRRMPERSKSLDTRRYPIKAPPIKPVSPIKNLANLYPKKQPISPTIMATISKPRCTDEFRLPTDFWMDSTGIYFDNRDPFSISLIRASCDETDSGRTILLKDNIKKLLSAS